MSDRPGNDTTLKVRLAALSSEAARVLGHGTMRPCADVRVRNAVAAALSDPTLSAAARREIGGMAAELATTEEERETRNITLRFLVTEDEADEIRARAEAAGQTMSDYVRRAALGGPTTPAL